MKAICFYFQVHQPFRLRRYRFFDIGNNSYYYDDFTNKTLLRKIAEKCYLPANKILLDLIKQYGKKFKVCFSITGIALEQCEKYVPELIESFKELADTGCVEFLAETYSHSLSSLRSEEDFRNEVDLHVNRIKELFGQTPTVFRNTELIYSDSIGEMVANMGFKAMLTEGAKQILGWKSPNYLYYCKHNPKLRLLLKNFKLSDDIAFRFSNTAWQEWPLTAQKFVAKLNQMDEKEEIINLFMDYETFGEHQKAETGIFEFLKAFPEVVFKESEFCFMTPSEVVSAFQPVASYQVSNPISWADEERDLTAWLGNEMQTEAHNKLYELAPLVRQITAPDILRDWKYLQSSDHLYYMCTKFFSDGDVHSYFNPYPSPYEAFINYMNVISDFTDRLKRSAPKKEDKPKFLTDDNLTTEELLSLVKEYETKLSVLKNRVLQNFSIDGYMTVKMVKKRFKDIFNTSIRIYKGEKTKGVKKANNSMLLSEIIEDSHDRYDNILAISENMTIIDLEKAFLDKFGVAIQIADANDKKLLDNKLKLISLY